MWLAADSRERIGAMRGRDRVLIPYLATVQELFHIWGEIV